MDENIITLMNNLNNKIVETSKKMYDAVKLNEWELVKILSDEQDQNILLSKNVMKNIDRTSLIDKILK